VSINAIRLLTGVAVCEGKARQITTKKTKKSNFRLSTEDDPEGRRGQWEDETVGSYSGRGGYYPRQSEEELKETPHTRSSRNKT